MAYNKLLFIEDDETVRFLAKRLFSKTRLAQEVSFAKNGVEALEMMLKEPFNLVLLDINLPLLDGFEVLDALTQYHESKSAAIPPIFLLTTSSNPKDRERAAQYPIVKGYLQKSFTKEHIDYLMGFSSEGAELETA